MQALIIYDKMGNSYHVSYGSVINPEGLSYAQVDVPEGMQLIGMDLTDPTNPVPKFESTPASAYTELMERYHILSAEKDMLNEKLFDTQLALCEQFEANIELQEQINSIRLLLNEEV